MNSGSYIAPPAARPIPLNMPVPRGTPGPVVERQHCVRCHGNDFAIVNNNENTMRTKGRDRGRCGSESLESLGKSGAVRCNTNNRRNGRKQAGNNGTTIRNNTPWNRNARAPRGSTAFRILGSAPSKLAPLASRLHRTCKGGLDRPLRACRSLLIPRKGAADSAVFAAKACRSLLIQRVARMGRPCRAAFPPFLDSPRSRRYKSVPSGPPAFGSAEASRAGSRMSNQQARPRRLIP
jgi:hypothetical protein